MTGADDWSFRSMRDQFAVAADSLEEYGSLENEPDGHRACWRGLMLVKRILRQLRGVGRLTLVKKAGNEDGRLDGNGCAWSPWTAADPSERRTCGGCGARYSNGWITDDGMNNATGTPLVRCEVRGVRGAGRRG